MDSDPKPGGPKTLRAVSEHEITTHTTSLYYVPMINARHALPPAHKVWYLGQISVPGYYKRSIVLGRNSFFTGWPTTE